MANAFRLKASTMFSRMDDEVNESPLRIVFLSVEGNKTERQYFEYIEKYRNKLGIKASVHIHPLQRAKRDNLSAPQDVLELLEEYLVIRKNDVLPKRLRKVIPKEYSEEFINRYLKAELDMKDEKVKIFEAILEEAGYDVAYNDYLREFKGEDDVFGIVLDRDYKSHTVLQMKKIVQECMKKDYKIYITTPLFEFWLLLHLVDIKSLSKEQLECIKVNNGVSEKHTYTSKCVSDIAGHSKSISDKVFQKYYLPKIDYAIKQAKELCGDIDELIGSDQTDESKMGSIGTNLPELLELLRNARK
ncbi:RloB family protein [Roseburia faecis]|uniref:RloB family protein n=1 Tax=Roseburia faecis TaxID=301302 RepID=UPI003F948583